MKVINLLMCLEVQVQFVVSRVISLYDVWCPDCSTYISDSSFD